MHYIIIVGIGAIAGIFSGLFGIGGGIIIVPLLMLTQGFSQVTASGTSLVALLLPVGLLGAIQYYKADKITSEHFRFGFLIAIGMFVGAYFGANLALVLPTPILRKAFSVFLVLVAGKIWLS